MSTVPDASDVTGNEIKSLIRSACEKYNVPVPTVEHRTGQVRQVIPPLLQKMEPKDFYQWFCSIWPLFEFLYASMGSADSEQDEDEWSDLVGNTFCKQLLDASDEKSSSLQQSLRAMCVSFMMNSLNDHPKAQSFALRMLLLYSIQSGLSQNVSFVRWFLFFMHRRIDNMNEVKDPNQKKLFVI